MIPKEVHEPTNERILALKGSLDQIENLKSEIALLMTSAVSLFP